MSCRGTMKVLRQIVVMRSTLAGQASAVTTHEVFPPQDGFLSECTSLSLFDGGLVFRTPGCSALQNCRVEITQLSRAHGGNVQEIDK